MGEEAIGKFQRLAEEHHRAGESLKQLRMSIKEFGKMYKKAEENMHAIQSVGQIVGEVLAVLDDGRVIVKTSTGPRYIVNARQKIADRVVQGARVALDMMTLTVMRVLPREVDPSVYAMSAEDPGVVSFDDVGGLTEQIRELREVIELPLLSPEIFQRVGVKAPKGVLLYGPPGTGKTLLARAIASSLDCNFLKIVSSAIIEKYIGESARLIREIFSYAKTHEPCVIFMDEIDAIGSKRVSDNNSSDREVQRTLMELLNQMDGFDELGRVKIIMATNRPDILDQALLRPGRLDRKIEIGLPTEQGRLDILRIHMRKMCTEGELDFDSLVKLSDGFNGADMRNVCTEAGMNAIRDDRDYCKMGDFMRAVRKVGESKKLEGKLEYGEI
ncbi:MAG: 26S proteasome regulatory subunit T4, RPT4/PSMC6 [Amphiamblys sp. WSBS2006]|nr:MAG: 26S proteasome regulatory subunit T4, RPT4/PSMC6 [Amphiamblys sp. WSBS2006]